MIIIVLDGGLGNQLFQYATAKILAEKWKQELVLNISQILHTSRAHERLKLKELSINDFPKTITLSSRNDSKITKLLGINTIDFYNEKDFSFDSNLFDKKPNNSTLLFGYFQSWRYFDCQKNELKKIFSYSKEWSAKGLNYKNEILKQEYPVVIHFRLIEFAELYPHNVNLKSYYKNAINLMIKKNQDKKIKFYIISDDINLIGKYYPFILSLKLDIVLIPNDIFFLEQWELLKNFKGIISSNSTFCWWGAYLNKNEQPTIIVPSHAHVLSYSKKINFKTDDFYPPEWIVIPIKGEVYLTKQVIFQKIKNQCLKILKWPLNTLKSLLRPCYHFIKLSFERDKNNRSS